jgi:hypothetical protein
MTSRHAFVQPQRVPCGVVRIITLARQEVEQILVKTNTCEEERILVKKTEKASDVDAVW